MKKKAKRRTKRRADAPDPLISHTHNIEISVKIHRGDKIYVPDMSTEAGPVIAGGWTIVSILYKETPEEFIIEDDAPRKLLTLMQTREGNRPLVQCDDLGCLKFPLIELLMIQEDLKNVFGDKRAILLDSSGIKPGMIFGPGRRRRRR